MKIKDIVKLLEALELKSYPICYIRQILNLLKDEHFLSFSLKPGQEIFRIRPNINNERYTNQKDLTYKSSLINNTYHRGNTPSFTMFYGSVLPTSIYSNNYDNGKIIENIEGANLIREENRDGKQLITFGRWKIVKDIPVILICFDNQLHKQNLQKLLTIDIQKIKKYSKEAIEFTHYMAFEFAKKNINEKYDYLISALFTERILDMGYGGIVFPNVRADRLGFKVAIAPQYVDNCMKIKIAGECAMYKQGQNVVIDNETISFIGDNLNQIEYKLVPKEYHLGKNGVYSCFSKMCKNEKELQYNELIYKR